VQFVIEVEGQNQPQVKAPSLGGLVNLRVIGGPSTNSSFVWSGGRATSTFQLIYTLLAEGPGEASIPGLQVDVDGTTYRTEPIHFKVSDSPNPAPGGAPAPQASPGEEEADVYLRANLSQKEVWVGQAVSLEVELVTAPRISSPRWSQQPSFDSFWVENVDVNPDQEAYRRRIGGRVYTIYPIERKILTPLSAGDFRLEPYVAQMQVRLSGNDLFDLFSRSRSQTIVRKSDPLSLRVKPLPAGAPAGFSGAVGRFTLDVAADRVDAAVGDAVALRVTVEGDGSLRSIEAPQLEAPPEVNLFKPEPLDSVSLAEGGMKARKSWEWIVVPLAPGELKLPEIAFAYFDPEDGQYRVARSEPPTLVVRRGEEQAESPLARGAVRQQRHDLAFIKPLRGELSQGRLHAQQRGAFWASVVTPFVLLPLWVAVGRKRARLARDHGLLRSRKARARARKRLQAARRKSDPSDAQGFHEEVARALVGYIADRFDRSASGITYDQADDLLVSRGVDATVRRRFRSALESCDFARFVPAAGKAERRAELLQEADGIIDQLERVL